MSRVSVDRIKVLLLAQCEKNFIPWKEEKWCHEAIAKGKSLSKKTTTKKLFLKGLPKEHFQQFKNK